MMAEYQCVMCVCVGCACPCMNIARQNLFSVDSTVSRMAENATNLSNVRSKNKRNKISFIIAIFFFANV